MFRKIKSILFTNQTVRQTVVKNTFWLTVSNIGGRLLRAVIIIYAARVLGAAGWGVFSYAISLVGLLTIFTDLGISPTLTKETARVADPEHKSKILSTSFFIKAALLALGALVVVLAGPRLSAIGEAKRLMPLFALILIFDAMREFGFALSRAMEKMEREAGLYLFTNVVIVLFGFIFLLASPTVTSFTLAYAVGTGAGMVATFFAFRKNFRNLLSKFSAKLIRPIISSAWPLGISGIAGSLMINVDIIILGFLRSIEEVGFYSAAQRPIQFFYILPVIIAIGAFPAMSRLVQKNSEQLRKLLERMITAGFLLALPIALGGIILGEEIIKLFFGNEYLPATLSFQILLVTLLSNLPTAILSNTIFAYDRERVLVTYVGIGTIANIVFDLILIPPFGIGGAAVATLISQIISNFYLWRKTVALNPFKILPHIKKISAASLGMALTAWILFAITKNVMLVTAASTLIYVLLLVILKEPLLREIKSILRPAASAARVSGESTSL